MSEAQALAVLVHGLRVTFGRRAVLDGLGLVVLPGRVAGVRGANGSGKTTLLNVILGLQAPDGGTVRVLGRDPLREGDSAHRPGVLLAGDGLYEQLPAGAQLELHARMFGLPQTRARERILELTGELGLAERLSESPLTWSSGMRRRMALARCFLLEKSLYVLDEPERGLDPEGRDWLERRFAGLRAGGASALIVSHDQSLLEAACDELYQLEAGRLEPVARSRCWLRLWGREPEALRLKLENRAGVLWLTTTPERLECGLGGRDVAASILGEALTEWPEGAVSRAEAHW